MLVPSLLELQISGEIRSIFGTKREREGGDLGETHLSGEMTDGCERSMTVTTMSKQGGSLKESGVCTWPEEVNIDWSNPM